MGGALSSRIYPQCEGDLQDCSGLRSPTASHSHATADASIDEVWRDFKLTGSPTLRTCLIIHYMGGHVRRVAQRLQAKLPPQVEIDDLVDEAYEALVDLIERFDLEKDVQFETFSNKRLDGAMRDYLRRIDPIPRLARTRAKHAQVLIDDYQKQNGRAPNAQELRRLLRNETIRRFRKTFNREPDPQDHARLMKHADSSFRRMQLEGKPALTVSFSGDSANSSGEFPDNTSDGMANFEDHRRPCPLGRAERADLRRWITQGFVRRDRLIIVLYYYEQMTMREIGRTLGCSESRVSQRLESILACLRSRLDRINGRKEFFNK